MKKNRVKKHTWLKWAVVAVIVGLIFGVGKKFLSKPEVLLIDQPAAPAGMAYVWVKPDNVELLSEADYEVGITAPSRVGFVKITLSFDPQKVKLTSDPELLLREEISQARKVTKQAEANKNGKIIFEWQLAPNYLSNNPVSGNISIGKFRLAKVTTQNNAQAVISVETNNSTQSQISGYNEEMNQLISYQLQATEARITLNKTAQTTSTPRPASSPQAGGGNFQLGEWQNKMSFQAGSFKSAYQWLPYMQKITAEGDVNGGPLMLSASGLPKGMYLGGCKQEQEGEKMKITCSLRGRAGESKDYNITLNLKNALNQVTQKQMSLKVDQLSISKMFGSWGKNYSP